MAKLQRLDVTESTIQAEVKAQPTPQPPQTIQHTLYKTGAIAQYREPLASDLEVVESLGIDITNRTQTPRLCRAMARQCCIQWGSEPRMPEAIRGQDADRAALLMSQKLSAIHDASDEANDWETVLDGRSRRNPGWDCYQVQLTTGELVVLDEPTEQDLEAKEQAKTYLAGMLRMAASLTVEWGGNPIEWTDAYLKLRSLPVEDFLRVSDALMRFRGNVDEFLSPGMAAGDVSPERAELQ